MKPAAAPDVQSIEVLYRIAQPPPEELHDEATHADDVN